MTTLNQSLSPLAHETTLLATGIAALAQSRNTTVEAVLAGYRSLQDQAIDQEVANLDIDMDIEVTV
jgi:hypothetical protein